VVRVKDHKVLRAHVDRNAGAAQEGSLERTDQVEVQRITVHDPSGTYTLQFGGDTTYRKAMEFLEGCARVEDWGCGTAYARRFLKAGVYVGVDGSPNKFCDAQVELAEYTSRAEGILIRHVLEHNPDWRTILGNALASFTKRLALIVSTPFGPETREIAVQWGGIPDISFRREDLVEALGGLPCTEESVKTASFHGEEHIFYVTRPL